MSSKSTIESPIEKLPYDLLSEIFLQCLPKNPLHDAQPDTTVAPMLLCHVCASWRAVALTSASLWSHLYIHLFILWGEPEERDEEENEEEEEVMKLMVKNKVAFACNFDFLRWWRTNQGSVAPFLRLNVYLRNWNDGALSLYKHTTSDTNDLLLEYLSSAHYLDVGAFYPYFLNQCLERGLPVEFPSLRSLVISCFNQFSSNEIQYQPDIKVLPSQIPQTLRRLSIQAYKIPENHNFQDWSALTHICLDDTTMPLPTWFTLVRTLVALQWGYFKVNITHTDEHTWQPPMGVLAKLSTLSLSVHIPDDHPGMFRDTNPSPLSTLLQNMEFPALRTLSLTSSAKTWHNSNALIDVHNVLKAAPAVTKLALGFRSFQAGFLCFANGADLPTVIEKDAEPLLTYAPSLSHLHVELRCPNEPDVAILAKDYIKRLFVSKRWLDLKSPMSEIRKVTIVIKAIPWDVDSEFEGIFKGLLEWNINKFIKAADVSFEIASEAEQGIGYGDAWVTWGSKV